MSGEAPAESTSAPSNPLIRPRSPSPASNAVEGTAPSAKKQKVDLTEEEAAAAAEAPTETAQPTTDSMMDVDQPNLLPGAVLPPSSRLFANPDGQLGLIDGGDGMYHIRESDVGIIEYLSDKDKKMQGIIKQRLVFSVGF